MILFVICDGYLPESPLSCYTTVLNSFPQRRAGNVIESNVAHVAESSHPMADERNAMVCFWKEHSSDATVEEMFLDSKGKEISEIERPEILSMLPNCEGKRVLELGAGIGRYTGEIAQKASNVTTVDFMEKFVEKNREVNGKYPNVEFICADVTKLERTTGSYDVIFSNWLLMYLGDEEVQKLLNKMLT